MHIEIDLFKMKPAIVKEIKKSELSNELKHRLLSSLNKTKNPNNKILKKKIDVDLSGYSVNVNTLI